MISTTRSRAARANRAILLASLSGAFTALVGCTPQPIRVMTFNIRFGTAKDGENRWEKRREILFDTIRRFDPDVLGLQEVLESQAAELTQALPGCDFVGVGRDDGVSAGEFAPIMFRRSRFELVDAGHFWLSPTPDKPGSRGWDAALPRIATWVRLRFRDSPWTELWVVNTHLDHQGVHARTESARLIQRLVESLGGMPAVVTGDFNCAADSEPHQLLTAVHTNQLFDAYTELKGDTPKSGTFHNFEGGVSGPRIDWILRNRRLKPLQIEIDHSQTRGHFPSDHFPVTAVLQVLPA